MVNHTSIIERRLTVRLLAYWEKLRRGRPMPTESDLDSSHIEDLWEHCFLVHVARLGKGGYQYSHLGNAIAAAYRGGLSEDDATGLVSPNASLLAERYMEIIRFGKPVVDEGEFFNLNNELVKYRQCLLPLGDGDKVEAIFGGMRCKIYPAKAPII